MTRSKKCTPQVETKVTGEIRITFAGGRPATKRRRSDADIASLEFCDLITKLLKHVVPILNEMMTVSWVNDSSGFYVKVQPRQKD